MVGNTRDRGQTTLDFTIGASVFLVTLVLVLATMPGLMDPFAGGSVSDPTVADRVANELVHDELVDPSEPYQLNAGAPDTLRSQDLRDTIGVPSYVFVNATLTNASGVVATSGPAVPRTADTSVAWRVVTYNGEHAELRVRVW